MRKSLANDSKTWNTAGPVLVLFFSHGDSLATWDECGLFDREVGYYHELAREEAGVLFVTYDKPDNGLPDRLARLQPVTAVYNRWGMHYRLFGLLAPLIHYRTLKKCRVFKSNQLMGAWTAAIAKRILRRPLVVRCGFVSSLFMRWAGTRGMRLFTTLFLERLSLKAADLVFVASEEDRRYLAQTHRLPIERIKIVPNPIDTDRFGPLPEQHRQHGLAVYTGRLTMQKNVQMLIDACSYIEEASLVVVGSGPLEAELRGLARGGKVLFRGAVPNYELPALLNQAQVFVLPSHYEGTPKALLEAMACGVAVVGTDVPGIREVIEDGVNGLLCEPKADALSAAIRQLLGDPHLRKRLGREARRFVVENYSQSGVVKKEAALLRSLMAGA